jgi:beta-phosphoglucomutase-like phosphatase (HAD superfamily)
MAGKVQNGETGRKDSISVHALTDEFNHSKAIFILDIDGTLLRTHEIDNECYWDAVERVFGKQPDSRRLLDYTHVTDSGILEQWCRQTLGRDPGIEESRQLRGLFLELIRDAARTQPELFEPRAGLVEWLEQQHDTPDTHLAVATGSWGSTARFKLKAAGLDRFEMVLASADDGVRRTDIMTTALTRLGLQGLPRDWDITYIGDGPWDYHASMELGWSFIGIAEDVRATSLRQLGALRVHADFRSLAGGAEP